MKHRSRVGLLWSAVALAPVVIALIITQVAPSHGRDAFARAERTPFPLTQGHWERKLNSVFTGRRLRSPWSNSRFANGAIAAGFNPQELECFDPSRATLTNQGLALRIIQKLQRCQGLWRPYSSGIATTLGKWRFRYGLLEARIWVPRRGDRIADWPAIWLGGRAEIDVFEGGSGAPCWYYHIDRLKWGTCVSGVHFTSGWHTVAVDWEPHQIAWYYDRHRAGVISSYSAPITSSPKPIVLDLAISARMAPERLAVPATFRIAWLRVWQRVS
jgi:beta-glucanase (GH16 family)